MNSGSQRAAAGASALALLLALGACGQRMDNSQMPPEHASVEINRQGEEGAAPPPQAQAEPKPGPTAIMGAGRDVAMVNEDQRIEAEVTQALRSEPDLAAAKFEVHSEYGLVTLRGQVPDPLARDKAGELARNVGGVKSVDNMMTIG